MYHYRILPRLGEKKDLDLKWYNGYVEYWNYVEAVIKYRAIITLMAEFFSEMMQRNNRKDTKYRHTKLKRLLKEAGTLGGRTF